MRAYPPFAILSAHAVCVLARVSALEKAALTGLGGSLAGARSGRINNGGCALMADLCAAPFRY